MSEEIIYRDDLIVITNDTITLKNYYFPSGSKTILFSNIQKIEIQKPTLINGKWRIWGTGNFTVWFPLDTKRPKRDKIFVITHKNQKIKSGFTVEDSDKVEQILYQKEKMFKTISEL